MLPILALLAGAAWAQTADWVAVNGRIYTLNSAQPIASSIAVKGSRILSIGDDLGRHIGSATKRVDLKGATVVPGFIDSHGHVAGLGESLENLDFRNAAAVADVQKSVAEAAARRPKGEWIRGRAWDQTRWPGGQFPTAADLSKAAPDHPVYLTRVDGHAAWVNEKALHLADVNAATPDPPGGKIIRDAQRRPTGVLVDRAMALVNKRIPAPDDAAIERRIVRAAAECARLGLTGVHDAGVTAQQIAAYRRLIERGALPVRIYAMIGGEGQLWRDSAKRGPEVGEYLTIRSIKLVADGALGSRGAALKQPYSDDAGNRGLILTAKADIERIAKEAVAANMQVNTHAIGDRANREVLEAYGAALKGANDRRFRIEHAQIVDLADFPLFAKYSILASIQATHATSDMRWAEQRIGPKRIAGAYAWQRFLKGGVRIANGSDFPVEDANPLWGYYASVTRQDQEASPPGGWMPDQALTRDEALHSWTIDGAYAAFEEKQKGTLEPGKLADFVVLSQDILKVPPAEILKTKVTMTVLGGKTVFP